MGRCFSGRAATEIAETLGEVRSDLPFHPLGDGQVLGLAAGPLLPNDEGNSVKTRPAQRRGPFRRSMHIVPVDLQRDFDDSDAIPLPPQKIGKERIGLFLDGTIAKKGSQLLRQSSSHDEFFSGTSFASAEENRCAADNFPLIITASLPCDLTLLPVNEFLQLFFGPLLSSNELSKLSLHLSLRFDQLPDLLFVALEDGFGSPLGFHEFAHLCFGSLLGFDQSPDLLLVALEDGFGSPLGFHEFAHLCFGSLLGFDQSPDLLLVALEDSFGSNLSVGERVNDFHDFSQNRQRFGDQLRQRINLLREGEEVIGQNLPTHFFPKGRIGSQQFQEFFSHHRPPSLARKLWHAKAWTTTITDRFPSRQG
jgi:hypothetical protein